MAQAEAEAPPALQDECAVHLANDAEAEESVLEIFELVPQSTTCDRSPKQ